LIRLEDASKIGPRAKTDHVHRDTDEEMVNEYPNEEVVYYRAFQEQPEIVSPSVQQGGAVHFYATRDN
jgi:hypothetical protein